MKKHILFILMLASFSIVATAQTKRIAILETIDKEDKVPYAVEVMVRSNLTKVISNTEGYEGYDRVNISQIMDEHEFERTGLVNEDQIRQLGEISGADYLLVSEAVKFDESNIFVTAKILNVESAKTEGSENTLMGMNASEILRGCESLANRLLGQPDIIAHNDINSLNLDAQAVQRNAKEEQPKEETILNETSNTSFEQFQYNNLITKRGKNYYQNGKSISKSNYIDLLQTNCSQAYSSYKQGKTIMVFGCILFGAGIIVSFAIPSNAYSYTVYQGTTYSTYSSRSYLGPIIGGSLAAISVPLFIIGSNKKNNAYKIYNHYCAQPTTVLSFGPTTNGIGVCLSF